MSVEELPSALSMVRGAVIEFIGAMYPHVAEDPDGFAALECELYSDPSSAHEMIEHLLPLVEERVEVELPAEPVVVECSPGSVLHWLSSHPLSRMRAPQVPVTEVVEVTRWSLWVLVLLAMGTSDAIEHWGIFLVAADTSPEHLDRLATILLLFGWNIAHGHIPQQVIEDLRAMDLKRSDSSDSEEETERLLH